MKIQGYFGTFKNAHETVEQLRAQGLKAFVDLNDHYQLDATPRPKEVSFLSTSSQSDLVLRSGNPSGSTGQAPLKAADPMVSGMGGFEEIADVNYKIVVEAGEDSKTQVFQAIKNAGGDLDSPNLDLPERLEDMTLKNVDPDDLNL